MLATVAVLFSATGSFATDENALGNQYYLKGNYAAAKIHFQKAIAANPQDYEAHYQLANTCMQLKDTEGAVRSYMRCQECNPTLSILLHCQKALDHLKYPPPPKFPPAPAPGGIQPGPAATRPYVDSSSALNLPGKTDAAAQKEANRANIMRQAEAEIAKMKEEEKTRWKELVSQSNRLFKYSDGTIRRDLSSEETAQFNQEVAQKEQAIRERAKRNCDAIR